MRDIVVAIGLAKKYLAKVFVQETVDHKVHHAVQDQEQVIGRGRADEPSRRNELVFASNHFVDIVELVEVEKNSGEVGDEEHADNDHQDQGKMEILGLL